MGKWKKKWIGKKGKGKEREEQERNEGREKAEKKEGEKGDGIEWGSTLGTRRKYLRSNKG